MDNLTEILYMLNMERVSTSSIKSKGLFDQIVHMTKFLDEEYDFVENRQRYWHIKNNIYEYVKCECGDRLKKWHKSKGYVCCSRKCANKKSLATFKNKTGMDNPMHSKKVINKVIKTNNKRYGSNSYLNSSLFKKEMGFDNPMHDDNIVSKRKKAIRKKYNVDHTSKVPEVKEKISNRIKSMRDYLVKANIKSCIKKYGVPNGMKAKIHIEDKLTSDIHKYGEKYNTDRFLLINYSFNKFIFYDKKYSETFEIAKGTYKHRKSRGAEISTIKNPINETKSFGENQIIEFIRQQYKGRILTHNKDIIQPQELDIYLPDLKLAIESNGLYWHSEKFKHKNYHKEKSNLCESESIQLLHVWEDDWFYKQNIIKSIISGYLSKHTRIYARKCKIVELKAKECRNFVDNSHIQGFVPTTKYYGLYYEDELVQVMSFRKTSENNWEISRLCSKLNIQVVGGTSRLFKHFAKNNKFDSIISYSSNDYFTGDIYRRLGMKFIKDTPPSYRYFGNMGNILSRQQCQKHKLVKQGFDPTKSEHEIMLERGYLRVYNSGNKLWKL